MIHWFFQADLSKPVLSETNFEHNSWSTKYFQNIILTVMLYIKRKDLKLDL